MEGRNTLRKNIIRRVLRTDFPNRHVLLEELRWTVLVEENAAKRQLFEEMRPSHMKSFTRTLRGHMPEVTTHKLKRPDMIPRGVVARAAVYRLRHRDQLGRFLRSGDARIRFRLTSPREGQSAVKCSLYTAKEALLKEMWFPVTAPLTLIGLTPPTEENVRQIADVPWNLRDSPFQPIRRDLDFLSEFQEYLEE